MADAGLTISKGQLTATLNLLANERLTRPLLRTIGNLMVNDARMNFRMSRGPDGQRWAPLKLRDGKPLLDTGRLRNSITSRLVYAGGENSVEIGTNVKYAPVQQFGALIKPRHKKFLLFPGAGGKGRIAAKQVVIPARPFIGLADRQVKKINQAIDLW